MRGFDALPYLAFIDASAVCCSSTRFLSALFFVKELMRMPGTQGNNTRSQTPESKKIPQATASSAVPNVMRAPSIEELLGDDIIIPPQIMSMLTIVWSHPKYTPKPANVMLVKTTSRIKKSPLTTPRTLAALCISPPCRVSKLISSINQAHSIVPTSFRESADVSMCS